MSVVVITGSAGLIGSESANFFASCGLTVVGIENDMRRTFFGAEASTAWNQSRLKQDLGARYRHADFDIRDTGKVNALFRDYGKDIALVIHTAAQPSHDWAVRDPHTDFGVNAVGTLNLLEATRQFAIEAPFIFTSTNKVYGDTPIVCRWSNSKPAGRSTLRTRTTSASTKPCRSIRRCTVSSVRRRLRPMFWCRSTAATSG